jgi:hypothetical protein
MHHRWTAHPNQELLTLPPNTPRKDANMLQGAGKNASPWHDNDTGKPTDVIMDEYETQRRWVAVASLALTISFCLGVIAGAYVDIVETSIAAWHDTWRAHLLATATVALSVFIGAAIWRRARSSSSRAALWGLVAAAAISIGCSQLLKHASREATTQAPSAVGTGSFAPRQLNTLGRVGDILWIASGSDT